jgi:hypothetical protein
METSGQPAWLIPLCSLVFPKTTDAQELCRPPPPPLGLNAAAPEPLPERHHRLPERRHRLPDRLSQATTSPPTSLRYIYF